MKTIFAADLFAGAGGASVGFRRACAALGVDYDLIAVNHWPIAVETHTRNHPHARHRCAAVEDVRPRDAVPGGRLHLLMAGPSCVHHSRARGGKPVNAQQRSGAWRIPEWADEVRVHSILVENVPEFEKWGPVGDNGRPLKKHVGAEFRAWVRALEALTYRVEWRVLNAADYGDPTTRQRLWIIARRRGGRIAWPEPTHSREGLVHLFGARKRWRAAREIIDWSIPGQSIFTRKTPLRPKTMARILAGLRRFGGKALEPFLMHLTHGSDVGRVHGLGAPVPTITGANRGEIGLIEPFLVPMFGEREGQTPRTHDVAEPLPTVTATKGGPALVEPFLSSYYGTGASATPVSEPMPTATARDRFALVMPEVDGHRLDIRFRMLQPHELAAAMSFGADYAFAGNRGDQVRQIGNAWPCRTAEALVREILAGYAQRDVKPENVRQVVA